METESIDLVNSYIAPLGSAPGTFSTSVLQLELDWEGLLTQLSANSEFQVRRLLSGQTLSAGLYYAAEAYSPESLKDEPSALVIAKSIKPLFLACIFTSFYLFKRLQRMCREDDWEVYSALYHRNVDIGVNVGFHLPKIGPELGLLASTMISAAIGTYLVKDKKSAREYIRYLKINKKFIDEDEELRRFGCSSVTIASKIMVSFCFGTRLAKAFLLAFAGLGETQLAPGEDATLVKNFSTLKAWYDDFNVGLSQKDLPTWFEKYSKVKKQPDSWPSTSSRGLLSVLQEIAAGVVGSQWLTRTKEELPTYLLSSSDAVFYAPTKAKDDVEEQIGSENFVSTSTDTAGAEPASAAPLSAEPVVGAKCRYEDLPPDIQAELSPEEFKTLGAYSLEEIVKLFNWGK